MHGLWKAADDLARRLLQVICQKKSGVPMDRVHADENSGVCTVNDVQDGKINKPPAFNDLQPKGDNVKSKTGSNKPGEAPSHLREETHRVEIC